MDGATLFALAEELQMLMIRLLGSQKKPPTGTPGSSAHEQGFDVRIETKTALRAYRVALVWTANGWQSVNYAECSVAETRPDSDIWFGGISYYTTPPIKFFYALVGADPDGLSWDNNGGWNYSI
jgi:hypothetical protein